MSKPKRCKVCKDEFTPARPMQRVCGMLCAKIEAERVTLKKSARLERDQKKETRARLESMKGLPELLAEAQKAFNAYIRLRDHKKPCICCGNLPQSAHLTGGDWDAGHYRSVGAAGHIRFNEDNVHRQLKKCNRRAFDVSAYRANLIARIGLERVEALEQNNTPHKWSREEVRAIRDKYKALAKK